MSGIKDLDILLSNIEPVLDERNFVFCSFPTIDWKIMYERTGRKWLSDNGSL